MSPSSNSRPVNAEPPGFRRAVLVWSCACLVYIIAITGRTSFGVAGVAAIDRFHIDASQLALFTSVQVGTYALAQIPMGLFIDRYGPRKALLAGALLMATGQVVLALSTSLPLAVGARVLIGAGDATGFLSVMRLIPAWFPLRKAPLFAQLSGALGQVGQFVSAVPFLALLNAHGWEIAFVSLGAAGIIIAFAASLVIADSPHQVGYSPTRKRRHTLHYGPRPSVPFLLSTVIRDPIAWQAFFIHWVNMAPLNVFLLLWGVPLMKLGMGLDSSHVAIILTLATVGSISAGPLHGMISAILGRRRDAAALVTALIIAVIHIWFFHTPEPRGFRAIAFLVLAVIFIMPAANYGFDTVREAVPLAVVSTATGLANMGGFTATMISAQLLGLLLDVHSVGTYTWSDFRFAWLAVLGTWALGMVMLCMFQSRTRRRN